MNGADINYEDMNEISYNEQFRILLPMKYHQTKKKIAV